jgi:hypothetical protein
MNILGSPIPSRLLVPGSIGAIKQPIFSPRTQSLPIGELSYENLQRLSVRLLSAMKCAIHCQEYGTLGQKQEGIDIYARLPSQPKMEVWQCKRYKKFKASDVADAVSEFLAGNLASETAKFVIVTSADTEDIKLAKADQVAAAELSKHHIEFELKGCTSLTVSLKAHPDIIDDFFGRSWVEACCGKETAETLGVRLSSEEISSCRNQLGKLYTSVFEQADSLLARSLISQQSHSISIPLTERWVMPTLSSRVDSVVTPPEEMSDTGDNQGDVPNNFEKTRDELVKRSPLVRNITNEMSAEVFIGSTERGVILGNPGFGKSALLRVLVVDLLSDNPSMRAVAFRFGNRLPVWLPFAFLSARIAAGDSVAGAACAWIKKNGGGVELERLVNKAIADGRLLLLIDGLDEWSDHDRARETIVAIQGFLSQSTAGCFLTARPLGYERLDRLAGDWKHGSLQPLSSIQQSALASLIFRRVRLISNASVQQIEVARFIRQLNQEHALREIASTPLMFVGLVSLWLQNQTLPESRLAVCEALIKEMMDDHPSRKAAISASIPALGAIPSQMRRGALALLAWSIHASASGAFMERNEVEKCFAAFFQESEGMTLMDARANARQMLPISDQIIGILSEASPGGDVQFVHRTFQELLAAEHLSSLPIEDQENYCLDHAGDPVWHQVILFLVQKSNRPHETEKLINALMHPRANHRDSMYAKLLLAEVVFSQTRLSPTLRIEHAKSILDEIEYGTWMPLREAFLDKALFAPSGTAVYNLLIERLKIWTPMPGSFYVYDGLSGWPVNSGAEEALWSIMNHEDVFQQLGAARALARRCKGDDRWKKRLLDRLQQPLGIDALGACLVSLAEGWYYDHDVIRVFELGRNAFVPQIVLPSIWGLVRAGQHDEQCKKLLLANGGAIWFREIVVAAATEGWPGDRDIKQAVINRLLDRYSPGNSAFAHDSAWQIAIKGYPGDDEIAQAIAGAISKDYLSFDYSVSKQSLLRAFSGHPNLVNACEEFLKRSEPRDVYKDSLVAGLAKTGASKQQLIKWATTNGRMGVHAVMCLLWTWGEDDQDVAPVMQRIRNEDTFIEIYALVFAPNDNEKQKARQKLISSFDASKNWLYNTTILGALSTLKSEEQDNEIVDIALRSFEQYPDIISNTNAAYNMIRGFSNDPRVRALAERWMEDIGCSWQTITDAYSGDERIRNRVKQLCRCLPKVLRLQIMNRCQERGAYDSEFRAIAEGFRQEGDEDTRIIGAVAVAESMLSRNEDTSQLVDYFTKEISAVGEQYEARMYAGFAGLVTLDQFSKIHAEIRNGKPIKIRFNYPRERENVLSRFIVKNWKRIKAGFGDSIWDNIDNENDINILNKVAGDLGEVEVSQEIRAAVRVGITSSKIKPSLALRAECRAPGWIESCFTDMGLDEGSTGVAVGEAQNASQLLIKYGGDDNSIKLRLEGVVRRNRVGSYYALEALAQGWPKSDVLKTIWNDVSLKLRDGEMPRALLVATCATADQFFTWLCSWLEKIATAPRHWECMDDRWFVMRRCFEDPNVAALVLGRLKTSESYHEWVSFPWLLRSSMLENVNRELRIWAEQRWRSIAQNEWHIAGFDLFRCEYISLKESLLELLFTEKHYTLY